MTRRRQRPSTSSLPTAAFSLLSTALCLTLVEVPRAVNAWVIPKSFDNFLRGSTSGQQQDGLLSPLHISTAESLIIGTPTSPTGRDGPNAGTAIDPSFSADATTATTSVPLSKRLQQIETPLDQWLQDVMEMTTATLAGLVSTEMRFWFCVMSLLHQTHFSSILQILHLPVCTFPHRPCTRNLSPG